MNAIVNTAILSSAPAAAPERALSQAMFQQAQVLWRAAAARKEPTSGSLAAWAILRGADPKKGFRPIANPAKLANGAQPWAAYAQSMLSCSLLTRSALAPWEAMLAEAGCAIQGYQWTGAHPLLLALAGSRKLD